MLNNLHLAAQLKSPRPSPSPNSKPKTPKTLVKVKSKKGKKKNLHLTSGPSLKSYGPIHPTPNF